ncbi:hypothetical protein FHS43_004399 [Streptosporangium becharense]|uniref:Secreted protein n=1 Tax=Streptosporangium becharense TaxID=1816182 RepID=A0A7W9IL38_9ACTN|nr:hypothetical protein [Streptosporangium becharense]MBB2913101.1 hypothetical protein [Streptosporangium becharense]MBB5822084.1 hypothetical protein [Streptosporangium becharense]
MRQTLGFIAVWCGATTLAVSISWFGVRDVLRSEVFDDARIESLGAAVARTAGAALPSSAPAGSKPARTPAAPPVPRRAAAPHPVPDGPARETPRPRETPSKVVVVPATREPVPAVPRTLPTPAAPGATRTAGSGTAAPVPSARSFSGGNVRTVGGRGGSVSFVIEDGVCRLVAAIPRAGYESRTTSAAGRIQVDLVREGHGSAAFCAGGENRVGLWDY